MKSCAIENKVKNTPGARSSQKNSARSKSTAARNEVVVLTCSWQVSPPQRVAIVNVTDKAEASGFSLVRTVGNSLPAVGIPKARCHPYSVAAGKA